MMSRILLGSLIVAGVLAGCGGANDGAGGDGGAAPFDTSIWETDFSESRVDFDEFVDPPPSKDDIPSIDDPKFVSIEDGDEFLDPREPVAVVEISGEVRAYPLQILTWHEIVNDEVGGEPVAVTYCPLCNSTVVFRREIDGEAVEFGTTGFLRASDLVMYDRRTESWWQQVTAEAVVGELTGERLEVVPSQILSWGEFRRQHPDADVLSRDTGFARDYGTNPYVLYDQPDSQPALLDREADRTLPPKERVAAVKTGKGSAVVYPFSRLEEDAPINDDLGDRPIVVLFDQEVASALDAPTIAGGRNVGAAAVFERTAGGRTLDFESGPDRGTFRDAQTGSVWNVSGVATAGPLRGTELEQVSHDDQFWFALAAFFPDAEIRDE